MTTDINYSNILLYLFEKFKSDTNVLTLFPQVSIAAYGECLRVEGFENYDTIYNLRHKTTNERLARLAIYPLEEKACLRLNDIKCVIELNNTK